MTPRLRIVIVEDDALIAMDMSELLESMGHEVCAAASTESGAVAAAIEFRPDLMIVDGYLADGSGFSAMARILGQFFVPHLYVTGDTLLIRELGPGAVVLNKPFLLRELAQGIDRALAASAPPPDRGHADRDPRDHRSVQPPPSSL